MMKRLPVLVLFSAFILSGLFGVAFAAGQPVEIKVTYYYLNPCGSCREAETFEQTFLESIHDAAAGVTVVLECRNTFQQGGNESFQQECNRLGIADGQRELPMLLIGSTVLTGKQAVESGMRPAFLDEKRKVLAAAAAGDTTASKPVYFMVSPCEECARVKDFLASLNSSFTVNAGGKMINSLLVVDTYNVAEPQGLELARKYFDAWRVPQDKQKVPIVFLRDGYLSGAGEIIGGLEQAIREGRCIGIEPPGGEARLQPYEWPGILATGIINGLNPCSISLLLFLITLLLARSANVLRLGLSFLMGKFIAYLALGTLLYNALAMIDSNAVRLFNGVAKYVLAATVLIAAGLNLSDFAAAKSEKYNRIRMQLPLGLRRLNHRWIKVMETAGENVLLLLSLCLGIAVSAGEFLCTGQIYLATILYLLKRSPAFDWQTFGALLVYIAGMLLPLLVLTLAVHKGKKVFGLTELARKNLPWIKLSTAAVLLLFAVVLLAFFN